MEEYTKYYHITDGPHALPIYSNDSDDFPNVQEALKTHYHKLSEGSFVHLKFFGTLYGLDEAYDGPTLPKYLLEVGEGFCKDELYGFSNLMALACAMHKSNFHIER